MTTALVLGGGAPNLTLMSGALLALDEAGIEFEIISTTGAGMLVGLLYAAPRDGDRQAALRATREMGVADSIYRMFPVNYKVFHKPGPLAEAYSKWTQSLPQWPPGDSEWARTTRDMFQLWLSAMSPSSLNPFSQGMCQPPPWIDEVVDFEQLRKFKGDFYLNAYCIDDHKHVIFGKDEVTSEHFKAALAMPMIYSPYKLDGKTYIEGSALDTLNFKGLLEDLDFKDIQNIVVFDILGLDKLVREPKSLYDAWILSIIVPLTAIAKDDAKLFELVHNKKHRKNFFKIPFDIPDEKFETILDWSYSNLSELFDIGYESASRFVDNNQVTLLGGGDNTIQFTADLPSAG
jgi:predicted acylesterase/phospholipase RssA